MAEESNNIIKRELTLKSKDNESFKLTIIKEEDEIIFNSYLLNGINKFQYITNLNIKKFFQLNKIFKKYKSIEELYLEIFKNLGEKEISVSLNNNKLEINLMIEDNKIIFILEPKKKKLDKMTIQKNNEKLNYIELLIKNKGIIIFISIIIIVLSIFLAYRLRGKNNPSLIDNNVEKIKE